MVLGHLTQGMSETTLCSCLISLFDALVFFSTPKAQRQSFTTPLPASPVTSEQKLPRDDGPLRQSQHGNPTQEKRGRPNMVGGNYF